MMRRSSNTRTVVLAGLFVGFAYATPYMLHLASKRRPRIDSSKPLKPEAVRRGAFNNSGSRDIGPEYVRLAINFAIF